MEVHTEQSSSLVERAYLFAKAAHESVGQVRKYSNEPYIVHPAEVAELVRTVPHTDVMIAASLLHDVVEDTSATIDEVQLEFGNEVASLVGMLTDVSKPSDGNRAVRKQLDREHSAQASPAAKTIKLADLISNSRSIVAHDLNFARIYLAEKALLLEVLKEGDQTLWDLANRLLNEGLQALESTTMQRHLSGARHSAAK